MKKVAIATILLIIAYPIFAQVDAKSLASAIFDITGNIVSEDEANAIIELANTDIISAEKILTEPLSLEIGDIGHGGGTVFHIDSNKYFEVSELLGKANWKNAIKLAKTHRGGGYDDWYLPSKEELDDIYKNLRKKIPESGSDIYWSSSESNNTDLAWRLRFSDGSQGNYFKSSTYNVRAIRAF